LSRDNVGLIKINITKGNMTHKIRMNTELRNKLFNKIKHTFENESTQEREAMLEARENVDVQYKSAFNLATQIVERAYPPEDVATLRTYKKNMATQLML
jgi:hypothetical protein